MGGPIVRIRAIGKHFWPKRRESRHFRPGARGSPTVVTPRTIAAGGYRKSRFASTRLRQARPSARRHRSAAYLFVTDAVFDDDVDALQERDIAQRVAAHRDDVGELA